MTEPPPGYASDPQLKKLWTTPASFTGMATTGDGGSNETRMLSAAFHVSLGFGACR